jgi:hypothetical protein
MQNKATPLLALTLYFVLGSSTVIAQTQQTAQQPQTITPYQEEMLRIEWVKAVGTIGVILVPLLIGLYTLRSQTRTAFYLKAAELVMQAPTPWVAEKRAEVMEDMFPKRLKDLSKSFESAKFPGLRLHDMKIELIRLLAENPDQRNFILAEWKKQFPGDEHKFGIETKVSSSDAA